MRKSRRWILGLGIGALLGAQDPDMSMRIGGYVQFAEVHALAGDLRQGLRGSPYYLGSGSFRPEWREDGLILRRASVQFSASLPKGFGVMLSTLPSLTLSSGNPSYLQDAYVSWRPQPAVEVRLGQFKALQTQEGFAVRTVELYFPERSQLARRFGIERERGAAVLYGFPVAGELRGRLSLGVFNGTYETDKGKGNDLNAAKDFAGRLEFTLGERHRLGVYGLSGSTDQPGRGLTALSFTGSGAPAAAAVLAYRDRTDDLGGFYVYRRGGWEFTGEAMGGRLGRRFPSLGQAAGVARREHLEQAFLGGACTLARKWTRQTLACRYDVMDYNHGRRWYGPGNPYVDPATGSDLTPVFREVSGSWTFAWDAARPHNWVRAAYLARSKNFLQAPPGETGARGGDTLTLMLQLAF